MKFPTYPPVMRSHFDTFTFQKMVGPTVDIDLVMSHLPEHTHAITNVLYNATHHIPPVFGYCHWFDLKAVVAWQKGSFLQNVLGLLDYDKCYINTQAQRSMVLDEIEKNTPFGMGDVWEKVANVLDVQYLGVDEKDVVEKPNYNPEKVIVFNHRPDTYKHFDEFMEVMDTVREIRQDFTVWIPLLPKPNRPWVTTEKMSKQEYYKKLHNCYLGFAPQQDYKGWSVATIDGMMNGLPYLMYEDSYYKELHRTGLFFRDNTDAATMITMELGDLDSRNKMADNALKNVKTNLMYKDEIKKMSDYMDDLLLRKSKPVGHDSEKLKVIKKWIRDEGPITKGEIIKRLGWGRGIKWTPYRRALLNDPHIFDVMGPTPTYSWRT